MDPELARAAKILKSYKPSAELLAKLTQLSLGAIVGPAGSGKDTLRDELLLLHPEAYQKVLSDTSRSIRPNEQPGQELLFKSLPEMLVGFEHGEYLQGAIAHGLNLYGIHRSALLSMDEAKISLAILIVPTEREIKHLVPQAKTIFLIPPTATALRERLHKGRSLGLDEISHRLESAKIEIAKALSIAEYYFIETRDIPQTVQAADVFLRLGQRSEVQNLQARITAQKVLNDLK